MRSNAELVIRKKYVYFDQNNSWEDFSRLARCIGIKITSYWKLKSVFLGKANCIESVNNIFFYFILFYSDVQRKSGEYNGKKKKLEENETFGQVMVQYHAIYCT